MDLRLSFVLWVVLLGAISGTVRWLGAPRWLAFCLPIVPMALWLAYCALNETVVVGGIGEMPAWFMYLPVVLFAVPVCAGLAIFVPKRNRKMPPRNL
jgi:hypothetical protein